MSVFLYVLIKILILMNFLYDIIKFAFSFSSDIEFKIVTYGYFVGFSFVDKENVLLLCMFLFYVMKFWFIYVVIVGLVRI